MPRSCILAALVVFRHALKLRTYDESRDNVLLPYAGVADMPTIYCSSGDY